MLTHSVWDTNKAQMIKYPHIIERFHRGNRILRNQSVIQVHISKGKVVDLGSLAFCNKVALFQKTTVCDSVLSQPPSHHLS